VFSSWNGACSGSSTTCQVVMSQNRSVTASFDISSNSSCAATAAVMSQGAALVAGVGKTNTLDLLRRFRDQVLAVTPEGRWMISAYYQHSPEVAARLLAEPDLRTQALQVLDAISRDLRTFADSGDPRLSGQARLVIKSFARKLAQGASEALAQDLKRFLEMDWAIVDSQGRSETGRPRDLDIYETLSGAQSADFRARAFGAL